MSEILEIPTIVLASAGMPTAQHGRCFLVFTEIGKSHRKVKKFVKRNT
jgi:hypothetical protein